MLGSQVHVARSSGKDTCGPHKVTVDQSLRPSQLPLEASGQWREALQPAQGWKAKREDRGRGQACPEGRTYVWLCSPPLFFLGFPKEGIQ